MKLPQLTLRDLLWLVRVVAMALGWWLDQHRRWRMIEDQRESQQSELDQLRAHLDAAAKR